MGNRRVVTQYCDRCGAERVSDYSSPTPLHQGPWIVNVLFPFVTFHSNGPAVQTARDRDLCEACYREFDRLLRDFMENKNEHKG